MTQEHFFLKETNSLKRKWEFFAKSKIETYLKYFKGCKKVLDVGSEKGLLVEFLRKKGVDATGLDLLSENEFVIKGNAKSMPFNSDTFDCVSMIHFIEHINPNDLVGIIDEVYRVLKGGGKMIIATPAMKIWNDASHIRPYPFAAIKQLLACPEYLGGNWKFKLVKRQYKIRYNAYARGLFYRLGLLKFYRKVVHPFLNFFKIGFWETVVIAEAKK